MNKHALLNLVKSGELQGKELDCTSAYQSINSEKLGIKSE